MARKKRRNRQPPPQQPAREEAFHAPFHDLKQSLPPVSTPAPPPPPLAATPPAPEQHPAQEQGKVQAQQERQLFLTAMADVKPLRPDPRGRVEKPRTSLSKPDASTDERAALADLRDLVEGCSAFAMQYTDEYMEGVAPGVDRNLAQRLHRGDYAIQAQLDLHGYTVDEAKVLIDQFLTNAYAMGQRCVRLIHGRGHNSRDNQPVLKEQVQTSLSQGRLSRLVLAFVTAPAYDGGAGAAYVLLRRATQARHI